MPRCKDSICLVHHGMSSAQHSGMSSDRNTGDSPKAPAAPIRRRGQESLQKPEVAESWLQGSSDALGASWDQDVTGEQ